MGSKLFDYIRAGKRFRSSSPAEVVTPPVPEPIAVEVPRPEPFVRRAPLDFPAVAAWLKSCEDDLERGRDYHKYTKLTELFAANECTRIDDIIRLTTDRIRMLAVESGLDVSYGLVNRVFQYAFDDVEKVKKFGKL